MAKRVNVTPADREAWIEYEDYDGAFADRIRTGSEDNTSGLQMFARHRIAEREACAMVAEDWVLVPREATIRMIAAGAHIPWSVQDFWAVMLSAAPRDAT